MSSAINISPVDVASLPSLADLFGGELELSWQRELTKVLWDVSDETVDASAERVITIKISFQAEADLASCIYSLDICDTKLGGSAVPAPSRMVFRRDGARLQVKLRTGPDRTGMPVPPEDVPAVASDDLPTLWSLFSGSMDQIWKRELVRVCLNIDDPRADIQKKRSVTFKLAFKADLERGALKCYLKSVKTALAPCKAPNPATMYMEREKGKIVLRSEPTSILPGPNGLAKGRQSSFDPTTN